MIQQGIPIEYVEGNLKGYGEQSNIPAKMPRMQRIPGILYDELEMGIRPGRRGRFQGKPSIREDFRDIQWTASTGNELG